MAKNTKVAQQTQISILDSFWMEKALMLVNPSRLGGWHDITIEISWEPTGPGCWYISTPGFEDICPIGLFVKI